MQLLTIDELHQLINWDQQSPIHWWIAYSGGMDSQALLHQLEQCRQPHWHLHAVHIHHGLHPDADHWLTFCREQCRKRQVQFHYHHVSLNQGNIEAQARRARYQKLSQHIENKQCYLVTAHHLDDQIETFHLQLLRGAGIDGLAAMPKKKRLSQGSHIRPLLDYSREKIHTYAIKEQLQWINDPSNQNTHFSRNYLRHRCMPTIAHRWPSYRQCIGRSIEHIQQQQQLLHGYIEQDLKNAMDNQSHLCINFLRSWPRNRVLAVLRAWLRYHQAPMPNLARLNSFPTLLAPHNDTGACIQWGKHCIRRYRSKLYYCNDSDQVKIPSIVNWPTGQDQLQLPATIGTLVARKSKNGLRPATADEQVQVRFNIKHQTRLRFYGDIHHRRLKDIYQRHAVPPWQRSLVPIIYYNKEIVAIIPYGIVDQFYCDENAISIILNPEQTPS